MTFLQPLALYGLPLALLPVIIHLLNLLRHRSQPWAATRFLLQARRSSSKLSRLKRWLTLLLRVLALIGLVFALSRPMTGGDSLFSFSSGAPEAIALILDRSASMETKTGEGAASKRELALKALENFAKPWTESRIVLVDSALREPVILSDLSTLTDPAMERYLGSTETAADIPATLATTLDWLEENGVATAEIVIASDMQESNWKPEGSEDVFRRIKKVLAVKEGSWRTRILALEGEASTNSSLLGENLLRRTEKLDLLAHLQRRPIADLPLRITADLDGVKSELTAEFKGESFLWRSSVPLPEPKDQGWLSLSLPPDLCLGDNSWYFAYGSANPPHAAVRADLPTAGRILRAAAANEKGVPADVLPASNLNKEDLAGRTLIVLQGNPRTPQEAELLKSFVNGGGTLLCFPPESKEGASIDPIRWQPAEKAPDSESSFRVNSWNENGGILANASDGTRLPLSELSTQTRSIPLGTEPLAYFTDGKPFLSRKIMGKGAIYLFSTLPEEKWSGLANGYILVPAIQRLLEETTATHSPARSLDCGSSDFAEANEVECLDSQERKNPALHAGVYLIDGNVAAVNRPQEEDSPALFPKKQAMDSLGNDFVSYLTTEALSNQSSRAEIWTVFLYLVLLFLLGESFMGLPSAVKKMKGNPS